MNAHYDLLDEDVLTRDQIREKLGKSKSWMYLQYRNGLPYVQIGGTRYTRRSDFNEWFWNQQSGSRHHES